MRFGRRGALHDHFGDPLRHLWSSRARTQECARESPVRHLPWCGLGHRSPQENSGTVSLLLAPRRAAPSAHVQLRGRVRPVSVASAERRIVRCKERLRQAYETLRQEREREVEQGRVDQAYALKAAEESMERFCRSYLQQ